MFVCEAELFSQSWLPDSGESGQMRWSPPSFPRTNREASCSLDHLYVDTEFTVQEEPRGKSGSLLGHSARDRARLL